MTVKENTPTFIERMFQAGAHFGYSKARRHPSTLPFIFGLKNRASVIDLEKTEEALEKAKEFARSLGLKKSSILFVGGKEEAQRIVRDNAVDLDMPYVAGRWIGGTLTNFAQIKKRLERLEKLRDQRDKGELAQRYTKKEQLLISREIAKLEERFEGILPMKEQFPAAVFVVDTRAEHIAVTESRDRGLPIIGLSNVDCDISAIDYPIVANDATAASIAFFIKEIAEAYRAGLKEAPAKAATPEKTTAQV